MCVCVCVCECACVCVCVQKCSHFQHAQLHYSSHNVNVHRSCLEVNWSSGILVIIVEC